MYTIDQFLLSFLPLVICYYYGLLTYFRLLIYHMKNLFDYKICSTPVNNPRSTSIFMRGTILRRYQGNHKNFLHNILPILFVYCHGAESYLFIRHTRNIYKAYIHKKCCENIAILGFFSDWGKSGFNMNNIANMFMDVQFALKNH